MSKENVSLEEIKKNAAELGDLSNMSYKELVQLETKLKTQLIIVQSYMKLSNLRE